jgi:hypothetical protein
VQEASGFDPAALARRGYDEVMDAVAQIAPHVDRLVFAVGPAISDADRTHLQNKVRGAGLESLGLLPNFAEFLLGSGITTELAQTRMRYRPPEEVQAWIDSLATAGLVSSDEGFWQATEQGVPLFTAIRTAQENAAVSLWADHAETVAEVNAAAAYIIREATGDHVVAALHRSLPVPENPSMALFHQMVTMRYIRQHDHAAAWAGAGLTAEQMVVFTELWHGGTVDEDSDGFTALLDKGLATTPPGLTDQGRALRDQIEDHTNERNREDISVLGTTATEQFLRNLGSLPPA